MESRKAERNLTETEIKSENFEDHTFGDTDSYTAKHFLRFAFRGVILRAPRGQRITEESFDSLREAVDRVFLSSIGCISEASSIGSDHFEGEKMSASSYQNRILFADCSADMFLTKTLSNIMPDSTDAHIMSAVTSVEESCQMKNDEDMTVCGNFSSCPQDLAVQRNGSCGNSYDYSSKRNSVICEVFDSGTDFQSGNKWSDISSSTIPSDNLTQTCTCSCAQNDPYHQGRVKLSEEETLCDRFQSKSSIFSRPSRNQAKQTTCVVKHDVFEHNPNRDLSINSKNNYHRFVSSTGAINACKAVKGTRKQARTLKKGQRTSSSHTIFVHPCLRIFLPFLLMVLGKFVSATSNSANVAVAEGMQVILQCPAPRGAAWVAYDRGSSQRHYISTADGISPSYSLLYESVDQYGLRFNASKSTGKRYLCIDLTSGNTIVQSEVIVLDAEPICFLTVDKNHINASCSIKFTGNWAPTMQWEKWIGYNKSAVENSYLHVIPGEAVTSTISMKQTESTKNDATPWKWQCVITFTESGRPSTAAGTNIPEYNYTWNTEYIYGERQEDSALSDVLSITYGWPSGDVLALLLGVAFVTAVLSFLCGFFWKNWIHALMLSSCYSYLKKHCCCKGKQHGTEPNGQGEGEKSTPQNALISAP